VLLTITCLTSPATDLGYLLHKNPANIRSVRLGFGDAHVFYPEASATRCTAALLVEIDPVGLVRRRRGRGDFALAEYVNDRPYVASSFTSVAIARLFGTAMAGRCYERPHLVDAPLALEVHVPVLPARGGGALVRRLFEPLGYRLAMASIQADERFPDWGPSEYVDLRLFGSVRLRELLSHLYVLLPALDDDKHYWVGQDEIDKLLQRGAAWLGSHPERELISRRYLRYQPQLTREALARLLEEDQPDPDETVRTHGRQEETIEAPLRLRDLRTDAVTSALDEAQARRVLDLGCGDGRLVQALLRHGSFDEIVGVDVSVAALHRAARRLGLDEMAPKQRERVRLLQGALTYRDRRLTGYDAAVLMEVIEHVDLGRLDALERAVFGSAQPTTVIVTTPNVEFNVRFEELPAGSLRNRDHRFEWTRAQFEAWAGGVADRRGYAVQIRPVGIVDPDVGPPTQMAVFTR
jgi:3' terminal RNA ribose 2'-O-methyltransferase Hen1